MRILVVEDEHRIAHSLKKGLTQEKYAVDIAYSGQDGLDLASSEEYDLLILDIMLPQLSGLEICRQLRSQSNYTPILLLTARGQTQDKVVGLDSGADDYLTKPFSFDELLARIRALTRRPRKSLGSILQVGELSLNPQTFEVEISGCPLTLSSKEFSLLEYLLRNSGKILTKQEIIDHVWDFDSDVLPNTVEVYMRNIRTKLDRLVPNSSRLIQTARGFGYRIQNPK